MLQVNQLHQYYGGSHILRGVDFEARQGEVTCLLGAMAWVKPPY
ncbi:Urea ABC transporter [Raoultella ornithinolytica]|nr:Urea ABC transporter [Raoultella ornithinolytica]